MIGKKKIIAIIPARGGSKGIKLKNLKKIKGKTLVTIVGEFVKKIKGIDKSVISTDHPKIAKIAIDSGLTFYSFRSKKLSGDRVSDTKVVLETLLQVEKREKNKYDIVLMLHPTSPLRKIKDVIGAIKLLINKKYDSVWTVSKTDTKYHPYKQLVLKKNKLSYFSPKGKTIIARQQLSDVYHRNSAAYVVKTDFLKKNKKIFGNNTGAYILKDKQISIDTVQDLIDSNRLYEK